MEAIKVSGIGFDVWQRMRVIRRVLSRILSLLKAADRCMTVMSLCFCRDDRAVSRKAWYIPIFRSNEVIAEA
jgi:hypothetical protein